MGLHPEVSVTDIAGAEVDPGETDTLPHDKTLRFKSTFDGELIIFNNNRVVDKRKLSADKYIELNGLSYGLGVQVVIGLDVIWQIDFKKQQPSVVNDEIEMLKRITDVSEATIPAPHSLRNIPDMNGKILYEVERGLDVAIGEYAPGRAIVVDKQTYQIGGFYYPGSERHHGQSLTPARAYAEDPNYVKQIISCPECGWFGLMEENTKQCPFCGNDDLKITREMMRPWGFAPRNAEAIPDVQLSEEYTAVQQPLYSTLPDAEEMKLAPGCKNIRIASRTNQRIIMLNKGADDKGFMVCKDCGAAMPGDDISVLNDVNRPYKSKYARSRCRHGNSFNVNLGYDFITDMLVLEFTIDDKVIDARRNDNPWLNRAAQSLAEALRLVASKKLDVEFTELVTGYRLRTGAEASYVDIYLYDSLSSGAGYAVSVADAIAELLSDMKELLSSCDCGSACSKCLKHYRNQYVHGMLDRFAALQLLEWGVDGIKASPIKPETQINMIMPLANILKQSGCEITADSEISATGRRIKKKIVIYPAMWVEPHATNTIFVSDAYIKYAKPYAVQKILDNI